jgi:hypothetical protein
LHWFKKTNKFCNGSNPFPKYDMEYFSEYNCGNNACKNKIEEMIKIQINFF